MEISLSRDPIYIQSHHIQQQPDNSVSLAPTPTQSERPDSELHICTCRVLWGDALQFPSPLLTPSFFLTAARPGLPFAAVRHIPVLGLDSRSAGVPTAGLRSGSLPCSIGKASRIGFRFSGEVSRAVCRMLHTAATTRALASTLGGGSSTLIHD